METPASRLKWAFEMHNFGVGIRRARFEREDPMALPDEVEEMVRRWLRERPGDADGVVSRRFEVG